LLTITHYVLVYNTNSKLSTFLALASCITAAADKSAEPLIQLTQKHKHHHVSTLFQDEPNKEAR
jgi:hypothetical protein